MEPLEQRRLLSANEIHFHEATSTIIIEGTAVADTVSASADISGAIRVTMTNATGTQNVSFSPVGVSEIHFIGGDGDDRFENLTSIFATASGEGGNDVLIAGIAGGNFLGGLGDDTLVGNIGVDQFDGNDGNDVLIGNGGDDRLFGGNGDDVVLGGSGNDSIIGDDGNDTLLGEDGDDWIVGGFGNDRLEGGFGSDELLGGVGDDQLVGGDGDDQLYGEDGNDWLAGGGGNDYLEGGIGDNTLVGGAGNDTLIGSSQVDKLYGEDGDDYLAGGAGNDQLDGGVGNDTLVGGTGDDSLVGGEGLDKLYGEEGNDWLAGGGGNDVLNGGAGDDTLVGGTGDDMLVGGDGLDKLYGEDGNDTLAGDAGNDRLEGGQGDNFLFGGLGDDVLIGNIGKDNLYGEDGNDWLAGAANDDVLDGGNGDDILVGGAGNDSLIGGDGVDTLYGESGDDALNGGDGLDKLYGADGDDWLAGGAGNDQLEGGVGNDTLVGGTGSDALDGGDGDDKLYGEDGNDSLVGGPGNDHIEGGQGGDIIFGSAGNDTLDGGAGYDQIYGGDGNDFLFGGDQNDWLIGEAGNDYLVGNAGDDAIDGGDGNDELFGEDGNDWLWGGRGNDRLNGDLGDDIIFGGDGDDELYGFDGKDVLLGEDGIDFLAGGNQSDAMVGGNGADTLFGGSENDVLIGGMGVDQIYGEAGEDLLIGGLTEFDGDVAKLRAIVAAWSNASPYTTRVQTITDALFTANVSDGDDPTVHTTAAGGHLIDDQVSDSLSGGSQQDWFLQTGFMPMYLPSDVDSEQQVNMNNLVQCGEQVMYLTSQAPSLEGYSLFDSIDTLSDRQTSETLTSLVPKSDNVSLEKEHLALMQLVRYDQVTNYAIRSGNWSDPTIWHGGVVPASGARVLIPVGVDVNVDGMIPARLATVRVDGTLSFDTTRNTQLKVDTLVVSDCGEFEMGTADNPIASGVTADLFITDNGPIDRAWDPFGISRGLISHGRVSIYGSPVTSYTTLAVPPAAGAQTLTLGSMPAGWKVGDSVVIAATTEGAAQNESRVILAINGKVVTLNQPLTYSHLSPSADLQVHIANVTRNAVLESESTAIDRRGHVMFMHNPDVDIAYAGFYKLGRTDKSQPINDPVVTSNWTLQPGTGTNPRARYSVHFHRTGTTNNGDPATVVGSAVVDSPGWGFVNHSSYVDMTNNVAFDVHGSAFTTEVGDEIGGFYGNLAIGTTGTNEEVNSRAKVQDFGFGGDGFWFQGSGVSVVGNISAGNQGSAFFYYTNSLFGAKFPTANLVDPSIAGGAASIPGRLVPVRQFSSNVGYASHVGLMVRYHLENATAGQLSLFENAKFWNNNVGISVPYAQNLILRNLKVINGQVTKQDVGIDTNVHTKNVTYDNLTVSGYNHGIRLARQGYAIVNGGTFTNNNQDLVILSGAIENRSVLITGNLAQPKIQMYFDTNPISNDSSIAAYLINDVVLLNYGAFVYQRLYNTMQQANAIPFPTSRADIPAAYIGLTNQQLWNQFGVALGGAIAPNNAFTVPSIIGLIAPV